MRPLPHNAVAHAHVSAAHPHTSVLGRHSGGRRRLLQHAPQEANEFPRDGDHGDLRGLPIAEMLKALMQPVLGLPRLREHAGGLPALPAFEIDADRRPMSIAPGGLHKYVPAVTVARLGDRAAMLATAAGVLSHDEADVTGELPGSFEPAPIADLRRQHHCRMQGDPTEALEALHHRLQRRQLRQSLDLVIELVAPLQLVQKEGVVLTKHQAIGRRQGRVLRRQVLQPLQVRPTPVRSLPEHEPAAGEELEDVVPRLEDLALEGLRHRTTSRTRSSASVGMRTAVSSPAR